MFYSWSTELWVTSSFSSLYFSLYFIHAIFMVCMGLPQCLSGKESTCQCRRQEFDPWVGKISWRRKWQPTLVFLPGKSHEQRSLTGYSPWGGKRVRHDLVTKQWHIVILYIDAYMTICNKMSLVIITYSLCLINIY